MNIAAIKHRTTREFVIPDSMTSLIFRLTAEQKDISSCRIVYWKRNERRVERRNSEALYISYRDSYTDDWRIRLTFEEPLQYIKYYFELGDNTGTTQYLTRTSIGSEIPESGFFEYLCTNQGDIVYIPSWAQGIVYYQIFPERFAWGSVDKQLRHYDKWDSEPTRVNYMGGDIPGILENLAYLEDLGIDCIYLNPIFLADFNHKYATTDYYQIDPDFGTMDDLKLLVEAVHKRDIRIVLDGVFNHVGCNFKPFADLVEKGPDSAYEKWFYVEGFPLSGNPLNYRCVGDYQYMPKLNFSSPDVREYILKVMLYWIEETGIDGWRLDVADEVDLSFWTQARNILKQKYPETLLLGETWGDGFTLVGDGTRLDTVMNYLFKDAVTDFFATRSITSSQFNHQINNALSKYPDCINKTLYNLLDSHDTERFYTSTNSNRQSMYLAVAFQMTYIGSPAIYYGDEIGMKGKNDPLCRSGMVWDPLKQDHQLLTWYKKLIQIRKDEPALTHGQYQTILVDDQRNLFGFVRRYQDSHVYIVFNNGSSDVGIEMPLLAKDHSIGSLLDEQRYELAPIDTNDCFLHDEFMEYAGKTEVSLRAFSMQIIKQMEVFQ